MITIRNDFHNTAVRVRANVGDVLTISQVKRCRKTLCSIDGCTCGGVLSERGPQYDDNGNRFYILPIGPDSVELVSYDARLG